MTTLEDEARAYAAAHQKTPSGTSWQDGCGLLMDGFNLSFTKGFKPNGNVSTAMRVFALSDIFEPVNANDITVGRFVFLLPAGVPDGHVGQVVSGQGLDALCFWASDALTVKLGNFIGFGTVRNYMAVKHATFKGVSEDYAGALPNLSQFSGGGETPVPVTGEDTMRLIHNLTTGHVARIGGPGGAYDLGVRGNLTQIPAGYEDYFNLAVGSTTLDVTDTEYIYAIAVAQLGYVAPAATSLTSAQITALAAALQTAGVGGVTPAQLAPVTSAILALATALGQDTTAIEAAIAAVPAAEVKAEGTALSNG